jgi:hypothetical protein
MGDFMETYNDTSNPILGVPGFQGLRQRYPRSFGAETPTIFVWQHYHPRPILDKVLSWLVEVLRAPRRDVNYQSSGVAMIKTQWSHKRKRCELPISRYTGDHLISSHIQHSNHDS